jgi:uracil-DNA glycosylase
MQNSASQTQPRDHLVPQLEELKITCQGCSLCQLRGGANQVVFGNGGSQATLMLVGEAPGADEDKTGIPFVGRAGQLLDRILVAAEIDREKIFITNVVKCRPPGNRLPLQPEVEACLPYLKKQIELINPRIIVCLGALATKTLIDKNSAITRDRGKWHKIDGRHVIATFHPAALLRDPSRKKDVWEDFKQVKQRYNN